MIMLIMKEIVLCGNRIKQINGDLKMINKDNMNDELDALDINYYDNVSNEDAIKDIDYRLKMYPKICY